MSQIAATIADSAIAEASASVARETQVSVAQEDFEISQAVALVQFLIDQAEAERDLGDAVAQAVRERAGSESQAASGLASTGNYSGVLPAALEVNTTRLEVRDASSEHYQKWLDYFTNGPQSAPSFGRPLPQTRLGGTQLVGPKFRQGEPNSGGQSERYDQAVQVYPRGAENRDAADSTISVMARVLHYTSPLAWLFITVVEWEMGVEQVHGGWIRFAWRTRDRLAGRQVDDAVGGAGAFAGGIAAESRYSKLAELHLELHRGTAGAHGITALAQPGLHGRQRRAFEAVLDYSLPATAGEDADGPLLTDIVRENSLRLSPMDAQNRMQTAPLVDEIINEISSEAIPIGMLAGALQARRIGNVGLRRTAANARKVAEGIAGAPKGAGHYTDFADEAAAIMDNAARSRGLNPNARVRAMAAPIREVDLSKLVPPPTRQFADPGKLQRLGPFDMSNYRPIQVEDLGGGRYMIMDGMTRAEAARRAGLTKLPVQIFPKSGP